MSFVKLILYLAGSHAISDEFITNKALYRPSNQSSSYSGIPQCGRLTASKAVDGNADPDVFKCHCFHTNDVYNDPNWMAVDLGERYKMYYVNVFGRIGMEKRLDSFFCGLTNNFLSNSVQRYTYPLCGQYPGAFPPSRKAVMKCIYNLPPGRFLILQMDPSSGDGKGMAVCEVEAYDLPVRSFVGTIWQGENGTRLGNYVNNILHIKRGIKSCIISCIKSSTSCDSLNYNPKIGICELSSHVNGFNRNQLLFNLSNWYFWSGTNE